MLNLNFGSIHTRYTFTRLPKESRQLLYISPPSSIFITHTLYDLALMPEEQLEEIRVEIHEALERFGGWTKNAITAFRKLDSILKEEGRYHFILGESTPPLFYIFYPALAQAMSSLIYDQSVSSGGRSRKVVCPMDRSFPQDILA
jgi:hypothetical protein